MESAPSGRVLIRASARTRLDTGALVAGQCGPNLANRCDGRTSWRCRASRAKPTAAHQKSRPEREQDDDLEEAAKAKMVAVVPLSARRPRERPIASPAALNARPSNERPQQQTRRSASRQTSERAAPLVALATCCSGRSLLAT